ncbi:MAG TPA: MFS transporter [Symbiobacteriaceae bacterium]|jgi:predicted MFS family arabinose efflux permease
MRRVLSVLWESFSPLRLRNLRIYLSGQVVSMIGTWMQATAQSWVVWELAHTTKALGIVTMLGALPLLVLGPFAGAWADRLDRRRVLVVTQTVAMGLAFTLAVLVQTHAVQLWHVYILATLLGCVNTLDFPSQQAFIGDLSGMGEVRKAVVINNMVGHSSRMLGPALAGWIIAQAGVAPAFWLNGVSFIAVIGTLLAVRANQVRKVSTTHPLNEFREGIRFVMTQPRIQDLLIYTAMATLLGISNMQNMPAFATDVLHKGPEVLGLLMGASGAGALTSSILLIPLVQRVRLTGVVLTAGLVWPGFWFTVFSFSTYVPLSAVCLFFASLGIPIIMTTANGLIQSMAPPNMRARLISTWIMISFGMQPVAALLVGYGAHYLGAPGMVRINGLTMITGSVLMLLLRQGLRGWEANIHGPHRGPVPGVAAQGPRPASEPSR